MKKLSISKALIGLFVVLAVGIGLAACYDGEYTGSGTGSLTPSGKLTLSGGNHFKAEYKYWGYDYKEEGSYKSVTLLGVTTLSFTADTKSAGGDPYPIYYFNGKSYVFDNNKIGSYWGKSVDGEEGVAGDFEVIFDGLSAEELEALGL
ncbi:hypothetical protein AGMMS49579_03560 [Spirochaetia bacterium]|nr:hypothetical protein AGMMS49579_03560 [Spirochaetia bacterium]